MSNTTSTIPFEGFYESSISNYIESSIEYELEYLERECKATETELEQVQFMSENENAFYHTIANDYTNSFLDQLENEIGFSLDAKLESLESPKEYNFSTDRIFIQLHESKALKFINYILKNHKEELEDLIKKRFTSCSGFISFYSNSLEEWGNPKEWDYNQIGTCFEIFDYIARDIEIHETIHCELYSTLDADSKLMFDELIERKEIAEYNDSIQMKLMLA